jgi:hypothetical protein
MFQNQKWTYGFLMIVCAIFMGLGFSSPTLAQTCGGNIPCECGDNVEFNRTLVYGQDPIVRAVCPGDGLIMNTPGVVLNLNGNKIFGSGSGVGILIGDGVNNVTIENTGGGGAGPDNFGVGIATAGQTSGSRISAVRPHANGLGTIPRGDGIFLNGDGNVLIGILAKNNGNNGVTVIGNSNRLEGHNDEYNGVHGIFVDGNGNELIANLASENRKKSPGAGIMVTGDGNTIERSRITKMNTWGIVVQGDSNTLTQNSVTKQDIDGIIVHGDGNVLTDNKSQSSKGVGISVEEDDGVPSSDPAASTGNIVSGNRQNPQCSIYGVTLPKTCIVK